MVKCYNCGLKRARRAWSTSAGKQKAYWWEEEKFREQEMKAQNVRVTVCVFVCLKVQSRQSRKSEWKFSEKSASVWAAHFIYSTGGMSEMGKKNNINRNTKNIFKFTNCNRTLKLKDASCCSSDFLISSTKQTPTHHSFKVNRRSVSYACFYICRLLDFFFFHLFLIQ